MVDPHTIATFAFTQMRRDPEFRNQFPWLRNTIVCVESDLVANVLSERTVTHFPEGATVACYYPEDQRFMFITASPGLTQQLSDESVIARDDHRTLTIGMLVDSIFSDRNGDYSDLPQFQPGRVAQASTKEVEKTLALA